MTIEGSTPASAAIARTVDRSNPWAAKPRRAAARTASRAGCDRAVNATTERYNKRWQTWDGALPSMTTVVGQRLVVFVMELPTRTTVLVSGAGPVGLALATRLSAGGVYHVGIARAARGANTSRAAVVHARTLEVLDSLGLAAPLIERGVVVPRFAVRDRDTTLLQVDFSGLPTRFPYTLMAPQNITEELLEAELGRRGGGVLREHTLQKIDVMGGTGVGVRLEGPRGPREITAAYVVGADGMHSPVRELSGIGFTGSAYPQSFLLADVELDWTLSRGEGHLFFPPAGVGLVAPLPGGGDRGG